MVKRRSLSSMERLRIFEEWDGRCHLCEQKIQAGEAWDVSHDRPLALLGADDNTNRKPAHRKCHAVQTAEKDLPAIAKAKRMKAKHIGAKKARGFYRPENAKFDWKQMRYVKESP